MRFRAISAIFLAVLSLAPPALSQTLTEETFQKEIQALRESPSSLHAETHLMRIFNLWEAVGPDTVMDSLKDVRKIKFASLRVKNRAAYLLAEGALRLGRIEEARERFEKLGFIEQWGVVGPFDNEGGIGWDTSQPPETDVPWNPAVLLDGKQGEVEWRVMPDDASHFGYNYLESINDPIENTCFYARSVLVSDTAGKGILWIGAGGAFKAFWNGQEALRDSKYRYSDPDRYAARVSIRKGNNALLVKVCTEEKGDFGFFARVTDNEGGTWPLRAAENPLADVPSPKEKRGAPIPIQQPLEALVKLAEKKPNNSELLNNAAGYVLLTAAQDLDAHTARDMAQKSCELSPSDSSCLLWFALALDRNERRQALVTGLSREPENPNLLAARARWEMAGPSPAEALPFIEALKKHKSAELEVALLDLDVLSRRGLVQTAYERAEVLRQRHPQLPRLTDFSASLAESAQRKSVSLALAHKRLEYRFDDADNHLSLARAAHARGDEKSLKYHMDCILALVPFDGQIYADLAKIMEGTGRNDEAEALLRRPLALAPESAEAWKTFGMFLMRMGKRNEGIAALSRASAIQAQDTWLAQYLGHLGAGGRFEEDFIIPEVVFLGWREPSAPASESKLLVDQKVVKVYESGLASSFYQTVFEIGNRDDAKSWRTRTVQFTSSSQQVQLLAARVYRRDGAVEKVVRRGVVPISEPWYRLYYDVAAEIMEFPKLFPGDVVELRYRVEDIASRNVFNDYFGDLVFIREENPKRFWRYILIAPKGRTFQFGDPRYRSMRRTKEAVNGEIQYTFEAEDVPALVQEGGMPGMSEVAPYLHVSTYRSWEELGKWYRGLIRHQMVPDERIRNQVKKLIDGKRSLKDKVEAIHQFVVTTTRYVGLEFGIHGYKPYRAPLVFARGFGDCKDKASLLVTMLREAGVPASFVLIRTNDLGLLESEPASLSVFNHAIAYVPDLDIYLDGTAEQHGIRELPFPDQGATALVLLDDGVRWVTTPVLPASRSVQHVVNQITLGTDGKAAVDASVSITGDAAAPLRQLLEAESTREERFESSLAQSYPGARLASLTIDSLTDLNAPLAYGYQATVPEFAEVKGERLELAADEGVNLVATYARLSSRTHDLILGPRLILERETEIRIPDGYFIESIPESVELKSAFGMLKLKIIKDASTVKISRLFERSVNRVTPAEYADFVSFARRVDEALAGRILLRRAK